MQPSPGQLPNRTGFALSELLIIVVVLGILSATVIINSGREYNRDRVNAVATSFAAWLQLIQSTATRENNGCTVTVTPAANLADGSALATVAPTSCTAESTFRITSSFGGTARYNISGPGSGSPLIFNRRGAVNATVDQIWTIELVGSGVQRCVQVTRGLGAIRVGVPAGSPTTCVAGPI